MAFGYGLIDQVLSHPAGCLFEKLLRDFVSAFCVGAKGHNFEVMEGVIARLLDGLW